MMKKILWEVNPPPQLFITGAHFSMIYMESPSYKILEDTPGPEKNFTG